MENSGKDLVLDPQSVCCVFSLWPWAFLFFVFVSLQVEEKGMASSLPSINSYDQNILNEIPLLIVIINNLRQGHAVCVTLS